MTTIRKFDMASGQVVEIDSSLEMFFDEWQARLLGGNAQIAPDAPGTSTRPDTPASGSRPATYTPAQPHEAEPAAPAAPHRKTPPRLIVPWSPGELARVRSGLPGRYQLMCDLGAALGLRQGELFAVSLDDLDDRGRGCTYRVRVQVRRTAGRLVFAPPKHERERSVPVPPDVRRAITSHAAAHGTTRVTLPWRTPDGPPRTLQLLFTNQHRAPLGSAHVNRLWRTAVLSAGITWIPQDTGMHMLRHVAASRWIAAGADLLMVRDLLGHADLETTEIYIKRLATHDARTRRIVAKAQPKPRPAPALPAGVADFGAYKIRRTAP